MTEIKDDGDDASKIPSWWRVIYFIITFAMYYLWYEQWHTALTEGFYYQKASILIPAIALIFTYLSIYQQDAQDLRNRSKHLRSSSDQTMITPLPKKYIVLVAVSFMIGLLNLFLISR